MIAFEKVSKRYRSGRGQVAALSDIALTARGAVVLLGRSGSGKSTLLSLAAGLEQPDRGRIVWRGRALSDLSRRQLDSYRRRELGLIFQNANLVTPLNVRENLELPLRLNGCGAAECRKRISAMLAAVGLSGYERAVPAELSGGELQRVAVARALIHGPGLVLADEPTASLDSHNARAVVELLLDLSARRTLIVATHDEALAGLFDVTLRLADGRLL